MQFTKFVPSIFYADIKVGLRLFIECIEFSIGHEELNSANPYCVIRKDGLDVMLLQNAAYAETDHPEFRLVTNKIEEVYNKVASKFPELLHPNLSTVTMRPWGAKEFALLDGTVGIVVQQ